MKFEFLVAALICLVAISCDVSLNNEQDTDPCNTTQPEQEPEPVPEPIPVGTDTTFVCSTQWKGGAEKAVCFTWDDGYRNTVELMNSLTMKYGIHSTFFVPTSFIALDNNYVDVELCKKTMGLGNEVGSHTVSHVLLLSLTEEEQEYEIVESSNILHDLLGYYPASFAHPMRNMNQHVDEIILGNYFTERLSSILDFGGRFLHSVESADSAESFSAEFDSLMVDKDTRWILYSGHSFNGFGYQPIKPEDFEAFVDHIVKEYGGRIWVDTYGNVALYDYIQNHSEMIRSGNSLTVNTTGLKEILDRFGFPEATISLSFNKPGLIVEPEEYTEVRSDGESTMVTIDLRKGNVIYLYEQNEE